MHGMVYEPAESASTYFGLSIYQADLILDYLSQYGWPLAFVTSLLAFETCCSGL